MARPDNAEPLVLVVNCGSSSVKYELLSMGEERRRPDETASNPSTAPTSPPRTPGL